ncbi:MAG: AAA family ATPase [Planctomycetota bacterium]|jgi:ATP-dependent 26S proteasome regulatory subunit
MPRTRKKKEPQRVDRMLLDQSIPLEMRRQVLMQLCANHDDESAAELQRLLAAAASANGEDLYRAKREELEELLREMKNGPLRVGNYLREVDFNGDGRRAEIVLSDGSTAYCTISDKTLAKRLRRGDRVWLEAQGKAVLFGARESAEDAIGDEARLERRLDGGRVEVSLSDRGRLVLRACAELNDRLESGEVEAGCTLVVCPTRRLAFRELPPADELSHFEFLDRSPVPDVVVERDIGSPPRFIENLSDHVRMRMTRPELGRKWGIRASQTVFLRGRPGVGKSHAILGFLNRAYAIMSEAAGIAVDELPPRVFRFRSSRVLDPYVGVSDQRIERFFDEVRELAGRKWAAPDGREVDLPVFVVWEEAEGLALRRGNQQIYDRLLSLILQRLDPALPWMRDRTVIWLFSSNVSQAIDAAFMRRAGANSEYLGELDRSGFRLVLEKHLSGLPLRNGADRVALMNDLSSWLFSPNGSDPGQVEIALIGQTSPLVKYRRDFLTGDLVNRAVRAAGGGGFREELHGTDEPVLDVRRLMVAFHEQVREIVDRLDTANVADHVSLPDGLRVGSVRRIEQPSVLPVELERAS